MLGFFFLLNIPYTYDNESQIISWVKVFREVLIAGDDVAHKDKFLFVNISYQKQLIPRYDEMGFEIGNEAVTDRFKLAEFFSRASENNAHTFIVCDVFLQNPSPADSLLSMALAKTKNTVFPYHFIEDHFEKPVVPVYSALSDYQSDYGMFTKYAYMQHDSCNSMALAMYRKIYGVTYNKNSLFAVSNGVPVLNSPIIDMPMRQYHVFRDDTLGLSSIHLQNLLELPRPLFNEMIRDRIVVVGDFLENDFHDTFYGTMAGPLIHANAFLTLEQKKNAISLWFFLYLMVCSVILSIFLFSESDQLKTRWLLKLESSRFGWVMDYLKYAFFLLFISILSYLMFGVFLNILLLSLYFSIIENVHEWYKNKFKKYE